MENVFKELCDIINKVRPIEIESKEDSIFSQKYQLTPEDIGYILLMCSQKLQFQINTDFIDALEDSRFIHIEELIVQQLAKQKVS